MSMKGDPKLGKRMRDAREAMTPFVSQEHAGAFVADRLRRPAGAYSAAAVGMWESGKSRVDQAIVRAWAELTNVNLAWLMTGLDYPRKGGRSSTHVGGGRVMPKISLEQALLEPINYTSDTVVHTHFPCSDEAFVIGVFDDRNSPEYVQGKDQVVIEPRLTPRAGDMVLAIIDGEPMFGMYGKRAGVVELSFTNERIASHEELMRARGDRVIGVMTESAKPGRPYPG